MKRSPTDLKPNPKSVAIYGTDAPDVALLESVAASGVLVPLVILADGTVISGHRRLAAALACGAKSVPVEIVAYPDDDAERSAIIAYNRQRVKTLTQLMREAEVVREVEAAKAQQRMLAGKAVDPTATLPEGQSDEKGETREKVAEAIGMKPRTYEKAATIYEAAKADEPGAQEALAAVDAGETSINAAYKEVKRRKKKAAVKTGAAEMPTGRYRVLLADPPWSYDDAAPSPVRTGGTEGHYPSMSIDALCGMRVAELAEDDAVLFLWTTSPMLEKAFAVIEAWGFNYKASFVWYKVRHNFGHYNSVRHEFLLVCTRGSCTPDVPELVDSVQTIERSKIHSQKPEEFRQIIEKLYTHGAKVELFARAQHEGWTTHGNQL